MSFYEDHNMLQTVNDLLLIKVDAAAAWLPLFSKGGCCLDVQHVVSDVDAPVPSCCRFLKACHP